MWSELGVGADQPWKVKWFVNWDSACIDFTQRVLFVLKIETRSRKIVIQKPPSPRVKHWFMEKQEGISEGDVIVR